LVENNLYKIGEISKDRKSFPINRINVLVQPRQTFDPQEIEELAYSIDGLDLIHPVSIALFDEATCLDHIKRVNRSWNKNYQLRKLKKYKNNFPILIAGEKRFRAILRIISNKNGDFTKKYFQKENLDSLVYSKLTSWGFIEIQCQENKHNKPPADEQAEYYNNYFREFQDLHKGLDAKLTLVAFAKKMNTSESTMREALRFSNLPNSVKDFVSVKKLIPYGIACEIARFQQAGMEESKLLNWCISCVVKKYTVNEFKKIVKYELTRKSMQSLFVEDQFSQAKEELERKENLKRGMEKNIVKSLYDGIAYNNKVIGLFESNLLGKEESAYSSFGVMRGVKTLINLLNNKLLPHIESHKDEKYFKAVLKELKALEISNEVKESLSTFKKIVD
jgi:hypothetical protein